jgi:hypothetical protein
VRHAVELVVQLLLSLAVPETFCGSKNHAGTVQLAGMMGVPAEFPAARGFGPRQVHDPLGSVHAAAAIWAGVRVSGLDGFSLD